MRQSTLLVTIALIGIIGDCTQYTFAALGFIVEFCIGAFKGGAGVVPKKGRYYPGLPIHTSVTDADWQ